MKRYIRTKDGKIYDTINYMQGIEQLLKLHLTEELDSFLNKEDIIAESDNILDLTQAGDLIFWNNSEFGHVVYAVRYEYGFTDGCGGDDDSCEFKQITKLYTKQNDNYVLVWDKERGVILK